MPIMLLFLGPETDSLFTETRIIDWMYDMEGGLLFHHVNITDSEKRKNFSFIVLIL